MLTVVLLSISLICPLKHALKAGDTVFQISAYEKAVVVWKGDAFGLVFIGLIIKEIATETLIKSI